VLGSSGTRPQQSLLLQPVHKHSALSASAVDFSYIVSWLFKHRRLYTVVDRPRVTARLPSDSMQRVDDVTHFHAAAPDKSIKE
jgi:hypothetical protein